MKSIRKRKKNEKNPVRGILLGVCTSITLMLVMTSLTAWLITDGRMPEDAVKTATLIIQFTSAMAGCVIATVLAGRMPAVISAATGGVFLMILACANIIFMEGRFETFGSGLLMIALGVLAGIAFMMLLCRPKSRIRKVRIR